MSVKHVATETDKWWTYEWQINIGYREGWLDG